MKNIYILIFLVLPILTVAQNYTSIITSGDIAFAGKDANIEILDLSQPTSPKPISKIDQAWNPFVVDSLCYVLTSTGMKIYDISDLSNPTQIGYFEIENISNIMVYKNHAYLAELFDDIHIVDVSDAKQPVEVDSIIGTYYGGAYIVANDLLFSLLGYMSFDIVDVSTPSSSELLLEYEWRYNPKDIVIYDSLLFASYLDAGILCYDTRRPLQIDNNGYPIVAGRIGVAVPSKMSIFKNYICFINWGSNLEIYDISNLDNFEKVGYLEGLGSDIYDIAVTDNYAYLAMGKYGITIIDLNDSSNPKEIGVFTNINGGKDKMPNKYFLEKNYPNPFNSITTINYSLPIATNVNLTIINSLGEKVKTIWLGFKSAGKYSYKLDANKFASGIYYYRIDAGSYNETKKMVLIK